MPRKRTSMQPLRERARLGTTAEINFEIKKLYRRFANGQIAADKLKNRVATLTALRAGMADPIEQPNNDPIVPGIEQLTIIGIPRDWVVIGLFDEFEAHVPTEVLPKLRALLPDGSITRPPSADSFEPAWAPPLLRVIDGGEQSNSDDGEPDQTTPPAA
jgi:hypothetical protein